ncbi:probable glutamine amidotransferase Dug3p [Trichomonascus vanleenenianus]|uniref:glutamine amidotransferase subunit DUG3 n=1 Tax=Trichomonascus vanleenenianus TaxID=2268995 RepID=UPI003ECAAF3F
MCRFLIFKGRDPILLSHLLTRPAHSIINQSFDSRLRLDMRRPINGDGFGVGYYSLDPEVEGPCVFCAITPAWNNLNLERLAEKTKSELVFAHVRASTAGVLSETNCHPFVYHSLMFMHNGHISGFSLIKRKLSQHIRDKYFLFVQGGTDSEWAFALFLECLDELGCDPSGATGSFAPEMLRKALLKTIEYLKDWTKEANGENAEPSLMNFAVTDGDSVVVSRYVTSSTEEAASLHFSSGTRFFEYAPGQYKMERRDRGQDIIMVASEPLTFERNDWITIPTNTMLTIKNQTVLLHPIIDEYYEADPSRVRSSDFIESKGLVSPLVVTSDSPAPDDPPPLEREGRRRTESAISPAMSTTIQV